MVPFKIQCRFGVSPLQVRMRKMRRSLFCRLAKCRLHLASSVPQRPLSNNPVNPQSSAPQKPVCSYRKSADQGRICLACGRLRWWGSAAASCGLGRSRSARWYGSGTPTRHRAADRGLAGPPLVSRFSPTPPCLSVPSARPSVSPSAGPSVRKLSVRQAVCHVS